MTSWKDALSDEQRAAAAASARVLEEADLRFVMMLFAANGLGSVVSNIEPAQSAHLIGQALQAARAAVGIEPVEEPLQ